MNSLKRMLSVIRKCAREQKRDLWVLGLSLAFGPLFVMLYYLITGGTGSTSYPVDIINQDIPVTMDSGIQLHAGEDIVNGLTAMKYENGNPLLRINSLINRSESELRIRNRDAVLLLIVPPNFSYAINGFLRGDESLKSDLTLVGDLTNPTYTVAAVMVMTVSDNYLTALTGTARPISLMEVPLGDSAARSEFENYVPALFIFSIILVIFQAAMTPAREVESGTLKRLRLTCVNSIELLGGITTWLVMIALLEAALTFLVALLCGFHSQGSLWLAILVGVITSLAVIGSGLIVAAYSKTVSQAFVIANFPLALFMFMSGVIYPMPRTPLFTIFGRAVAIYDILPTTHAVLALNKIFTLGLGLKDIVFELSALSILSMIFFIVGVWAFQKKQMSLDE
jgi:ABC-2 type transport system permease protein